MSYRDFTITAPQQSLKEAEEAPTPVGMRHLHYAYRSGEGRWTVRSRRNPLCRTARCRLVSIVELPAGEEAS